MVSSCNETLLTQCFGNCPTELMHTDYGETIRPVLRLLHFFLSTYIVHCTFGNEAQLQEQLEAWPAFVSGHGLRLPHNMRVLRTLGAAVVLDGYSPGKEVEVAWVERVTSRYGE